MSYCLHYSNLSGGFRACSEILGLAERIGRGFEDTSRPVNGAAGNHRVSSFTPLELSGRLVFPFEGESDEGVPGRNRPDRRFSRSR
jgi:hypothetical protein